MILINLLTFKNKINAGWHIDHVILLNGFLCRAVLYEWTLRERTCSQFQRVMGGLAVPCRTLLSGCFQFSNRLSWPAKKLVVTSKTDQIKW